MVGIRELIRTQIAAAMRRLHFHVAGGLLMTAICATGAQADVLPPSGRTPELWTQLVLDESLGGTEELPFPSPFLVNRLRFAQNSVLTDTAAVPDGAAFGRVGIGFAMIAVRSSSTRESASPGVYGNAKVEVGTRDAIRVIPADPSLIGKPGRMVALLDISGDGSAAKPLGWDGMSAGGSRASYGVGVEANGQSLGYGGRWDSTDGGGSLFVGDVFGTKRLEFGFVFGDLFMLELSASCETRASGSLPGTAFASLGLTSVRWMGLDEVTDDQGNRIDSYSVVSASGVDWSSAVPIPEPHTFFWLVLAFLPTGRWTNQARRIRSAPHCGQ